MIWRSSYFFDWCTHAQISISQIFIKFHQTMVPYDERGQHDWLMPSAIFGKYSALCNVDLMISVINSQFSQKVSVQAPKAEF